MGQPGSINSTTVSKNKAVHEVQEAGKGRGKHSVCPALQALTRDTVKNEVVSLSFKKDKHSSKEGEMPSAGGIRKDIARDKGLEIRCLKFQHNLMEHFSKK